MCIHGALTTARRICFWKRRQNRAKIEQEWLEKLLKNDWRNEPETLKTVATSVYGCLRQLWLVPCPVLMMVSNYLIEPCARRCRCSRWPSLCCGPLHNGLPAPSSERRCTFDSFRLTCSSESLCYCTLVKSNEQDYLPKSSYRKKSLQGGIFMNLLEIYNIYYVIWRPRQFSFCPPRSGRLTWWYNRAQPHLENEPWTRTAVFQNIHNFINNLVTFLARIFAWSA
jgi:hypothetical protein